MTTRSGRLYKKSGEMASDGAESSVADVLRMVEDRRKREEELAEELRRRGADD